MKIFEMDLHIFAYILLVQASTLVPLYVDLQHKRGRLRYLTLSLRYLVISP
ncbi:hypothetical protein V5G30_04410 [Mannheimia haemolytica]|uniref:hypothetical protein n=1 Tax=Mannheimia haemolytica TaxID=75985 RepID=UPI000AB9242A|nr:hypothetical protein [Mannheimia haemolytica]